MNTVLESREYYVKSLVKMMAIGILVGVITQVMCSGHFILGFCIPFGWKLASSIMPGVVIGSGGLVYIACKFLLAILIGIVALPITTVYHIYKIVTCN